MAPLIKAAFVLASSWRRSPPRRVGSTPTTVVPPSPAGARGTLWKAAHEPREDPLDALDLVDLHALEQAGLESYAQQVVDEYTQTERPWPAADDCALEPARPIAVGDVTPPPSAFKPPAPARPCGSRSEADYAQEYWHDPRIHSFGNVGIFGAVHAGVAPLFTLGIDLFAYGGIDLRVQVLEQLNLARAARLGANVRLGADDARRLGGEPRTIVDLGCGTGTMTRALADQWPHARVTAIDTSEEMLGVARALTAAALGSDPKVTYALGNAEATDLPSHSADVVTVSFLLHEAPARGRAAIIAEARRLLAPGGTLLVVDIARAYEPSPMMLIGEPYVRGYQQHVDAELRRAFAHDGHKVEFFEPVPGAAEMWFCHAPVATRDAARESSRDAAMPPLRQPPARPANTEDTPRERTAA